MEEKKKQLIEEVFVAARLQQMGVDPTNRDILVKLLNLEDDLIKDLTELEELRKAKKK